MPQSGTSYGLVPQQHALLLRRCLPPGATGLATTPARTARLMPALGVQRPQEAAAMGWAARAGRWLHWPPFERRPLRLLVEH